MAESLKAKWERQLENSQMTTSPPGVILGGPQIDTVRRLAALSNNPLKQIVLQEGAGPSGHPLMVTTVESQSETTVVLRRDMLSFLRRNSPEDLLVALAHEQLHVEVARAYPKANKRVRHGVIWMWTVVAAQRLGGNVGLWNRAFETYLADNNFSKKEKEWLRKLLQKMQKSYSQNSDVCEECFKYGLAGASGYSSIGRLSGLQLDGLLTEGNAKR